jgi:hypothetical protein
VVNAGRFEGHNEKKLQVNVEVILHMVTLMIDMKQNKRATTHQRLSFSVVA